MKKPTKFVVIDGSPAPDTPRERANKRLRSIQAAVPGPPVQVRCHRCTSLAVMEVKLGMTIRRGGKPVGGQKQLICAKCFMNGEWVTI